MDLVQHGIEGDGQFAYLRRLGAYLDALVEVTVGYFFCRIRHPLEGSARGAIPTPPPPDGVERAAPPSTSITTRRFNDEVTSPVGKATTTRSSLASCGPMYASQPAGPMTEPSWTRCRPLVSARSDAVARGARTWR